MWQRGDVIGCMIDMNDKTISTLALLMSIHRTIPVVHYFTNTAGFSLNGELMMDMMGQEIAFKGIDVTASYVPAFTMGASQQARINFGQDVNTLKFFTCCGLQEGYEPFCVYAF